MKRRSRRRYSSIAPSSAGFSSNLVRIASSIRAKAFAFSLACASAVLARISSSQIFLSAVSRRDLPVLAASSASLGELYDCNRNHVAEWRDKAVELRVLATTIKSIEIQEKACRLADEYDGLADQTEALIGNIRLAIREVPTKTQAQSR